LALRRELAQKYDAHHVSANLQPRTTDEALNMKIDNATVLITGANRGLYLAFAREALARDERALQLKSGLAADAGRLYLLDPSPGAPVASAAAR
jgi:hypothetical protein